jgi:hypothetical protein
MIRQRLILATLVIVAVAAGTLEAQGRGPQWALLGQRAVTDRVDHDTIKVTAAKGDFKAIKFEVIGRAVDFHRAVIHFANGADQNVELRHTIPAGGQSRVIDIVGRDRVIRSIDFWYDAKTIAKGGRANVRALGRR